MLIKIKNTPENKKFLTEMNHQFAEQGKFLIHQPNDYHNMWLENGQITPAKYKKHVLGL